MVMERFYRDPRTLTRMGEGALGPFVGAFAAHPIHVIGPDAVITRFSWWPFKPACAWPNSPACAAML